MSDGKTVIVLGADGLAGRAVCLEFQRHAYSVESFGAPGTCKHGGVDIRSRESVDSNLFGIRADVLVNCAAYTDVDKSEEWCSGLAADVNAFGAYNVACWCAKNNVRLVHLSSNFIDGMETQKWSCEKHCSEMRPANFYGQTKLFGEMAVDGVFSRRFAGRAHIVRTSWLFGHGRTTFVDWVVSVAFGHLPGFKDPILVPTDEMSMPTSTEFLAKRILEISEDDEGGLVHFDSVCCGDENGNPGYVSKFDYARCAVDTWAEISGETQVVDVVPSTRDIVYAGKAKRPRFCSLFYYTKKHPYWKDEIRKYLEQKYAEQRDMVFSKVEGPNCGKIWSRTDCGQTHRTVCFQPGH